MPPSRWRFSTPRLLLILSVLAPTLLVVATFTQAPELLSVRRWIAAPDRPQVLVLWGTFGLAFALSISAILSSIIGVRRGSGSRRTLWASIGLSVALVAAFLARLLDSRGRPSQAETPEAAAIPRDPASRSRS